MKITGRYQKGSSAVVNIILLLVVGYGGYVGFHYAPIFIESRTIDSMLDNVKLANKGSPAQSMHDAQGMIDKQLMINGMTHMQNKFHVRRMGGGYEIQVSYERSLDILFEEKTLRFEKDLVLQ
jgi:hypothetical protein